MSHISSVEHGSLVMGWVIAAAAVGVVIWHGKAAPDHLIRGALHAVATIVMSAALLGIHWVATQNHDSGQAHSVSVMAVVLLSLSAAWARGRQRAFRRRAQRQFETRAAYNAALQDRADELRG